MSGGLFGGDAWLKDQEAIYNHAKGLGIADVPHPWGPDRIQGNEDDLTKGEWKAFTDRANAAKEIATAGGTQDFVLGATDAQKQRSSDWYTTQGGADYAESLGLPSGFGIRDGGGDGGGASRIGGQWIIDAYPGAGIGPYPADNMYFPQLVPEYAAPQAQDWSQYLPFGSPLSQMGGLLYQPGTQEYMEQFPMPENIWNYQPPQINRQPVQYSGPPMGGLMEVIMPGGEEDEEEYDPNKDPGWDEGGGGADDPNMASDMVEVNGAKVPRGVTIYNGKITTFADAERAKQAAAAEAAVDAVVDTGIGLGVGFPSDY